MRFEWDELKNRSNLAKHGVNFHTAEQVFHDPFLFSKVDDSIEVEERWLSVGTVSGRVLFIVHTYEELSGETLVRIISARKATRHERTDYERGT